VLADYNTKRAQDVAAMVNDPAKFVPEHINARSAADIASLIRKHNCNYVMNACDPSFVEPIFDACLETGS
jgi:hypothetical protein